MYMGRGFSLGRTAAGKCNAPLFVVSAGLGLVAGDQVIPSYGLTVTSRDSDSVQQTVVGRFDARIWWSSIKQGPYSTDWYSVLNRPGLILIALSQGYANLVADDLAALATADRSRLRLFGIGLQDVLAPALATQVMPYDDRLDSLLPGTRTDFAQRALSHYASSIVMHGETTAARHAVEQALSDVRAPDRVLRPRASDDELVGVIRRHLRTTRGIGRVLSRIRHEDSIACEQRRFTRLYRVAEQLEVTR